MKLNSKFAALLAAGVTASSASAATVISSTSDAEATSGGGVGALGNQSILAGAYYAAGPGVTPVFAFLLPTLGPGETFSSASISLELLSISGTPTFNGDIVGIRSNAADTVLGADWAATGTMLHDDFYTSGSSAGASTSNDFAAWLNTQNDGEYVFIKLDAEGTGGVGSFTGYNVKSANHASATNLPTLNYTVVPEPSSAALLGLGGLALLKRRRR